jgi:hypothetical protein
MARPNSTQSAQRPSPWIDEDGDILVSSVSSTSDEFDPEFDSSGASATAEKSPTIGSKSQTTPSTSHPGADVNHAHSTPTLRIKQKESKTLAQPGTTSSPQPLDYRDVPLPIDSALRDALRGGEPVLTAIFGKTVIDILHALEERLSDALYVSDGKTVIQAAVWTTASLGLSRSDHVTLKQAAKKISDRDQWDRIIKAGKETLDPAKYEATVLGNADTRCKMVFRLLQML